MIKQILLITVLVFLLIVMIHPLIFANPIPAPTIILDHEDIAFNFTYLSNGVVNVSVYGKYTMRNAGYDVITMYFPVPNETDRKSVRVLVNGEEMSYGFTWDMIVQGHKHKYYTVMGPLPLITWHVMSREEKYIVEVYYNYKFNIRDGVGETIYALGTGKYYYTYSKQCIARINISLKGFNNTLLNIKLNAPNQTETLVYAKLINKPIRTSIVLVSNMFSSFKRDLLFIFNQINPDNYSEGYARKIYLRIDPLLETEHLKIHGSVTFNSGGYALSRLEIISRENEIDVVMNIIQIKSPATMIIKEINYELYSPLNMSETGKMIFKLIVNGKILVNKTLNYTQPIQPLIEEQIVQKPLNNSTTPITNKTPPTETTNKPPTQTTTPPTTPSTSPIETTKNTTPALIITAIIIVLAILATIILKK